MAKEQGGALRALLTFIAWLTGVIVSLSVGFALINRVLTLPNWLGGTIGVPVVAGWVVVITTILSVVLALVHKFNR